MTAVTDWQGATAVLSVSGEVDMVTGPQFETALFAALEEHPETLIVNLEGVEFFASTGLSALVAAQQRAGASTVCVVATNSVTARPLEITGLDRTIPIYESVRQALAVQETS